MKNLFFFLATIVLLNACNKKSDPEPVLPGNYWGEATGYKNGVLWSSYPACWIDLIDKNTITVELDSFYKGYRLYYARESLIISKIPPFPGTYKVEKFKLNVTNVYSHLSFWDDDQLLGEYDILESDSNTNLVTLQSIDTLSKEIRGSFNLSYLVQHRPYPNAPDTIRFKNGMFHGKIIKKY